MIKEVFGGSWTFEVPSTDVQVEGISYLSGFIRVDPDSVKVVQDEDVTETFAVYFQGDFHGDGLLGEEKVEVLGKVKGHVIARADNPSAWVHYEFEFIDRPLILGPKKYKVNLTEIYKRFPNKYVHEIEKTLGVSRGTLAKWKKNPVVSLKIARKIARLVPKAIEPLDGETKT